MSPVADAVEQLDRVADSIAAPPAPIAAEEPSVEPALAPKKRSPLYDVFELRHFGEEGYEGVDAFVRISESERATNRRAAIKAATADFDDDRRFGTFATVLHDEWEETTRDKEVTVKETWS